MSLPKINLLKSKYQQRSLIFPKSLRTLSLTISVTVTTFGVVLLIYAANTTVGTNITTSGTLSVTGVATFTNASTTGMLTIGNGFISSASSTVASTLVVSGQLQASSTLLANGLATLTGGFVSSASSTVNANLNVSGPLSASSTLTVSGLASLGGGFISSASSTISSGGLIVTGAPIQASSTYLLVTGTTASNFERNNADNNLRGAIILKRTRSDSTAPNADFGAHITWDLEGFTDNSIAPNAGQIGVAWIRNQTNDTTDRDAYMRFSTMLDDVIYERMRLLPDGKLGLGTTTPKWLFQIADARPFFALTDTDAGTNLKHWTLSSQGGNFYVATSSDAFATSSVPALMISSNGLVGIGTSSPQSKLSIEGNCIDTAAAGVGCVDYAELYPSSEPVEPGDLLALDPDQPGSVKKANLDNKNLLIGAVSSRPAILIEGSSLQLLTGLAYQPNSNKPAVALAGRIPVKVNLEAGEIKVGDPITISSQAGVGKKATESGKIVGYALDNYSGLTDQNKGKVMMFISLANWAASSSSDNELLAKVVDLVKGWLKDMQVLVEEGIVRLKELVAEKIIAQKAIFNKVELKDEDTGDIYCLRMKGGALLNTLGNCGD